MQRAIVAVQESRKWIASGSETVNDTAKCYQQQIHLVFLPNSSSFCFVSWRRKKSFEGRSWAGATGSEQWREKTLSNFYDNLK